ncbi:hypothetical protein BDW62DRAFT_93169 [Aspergillus aurantiobrunneus]
MVEVLSWGSRGHKVARMTCKRICILGLFWCSVLKSPLCFLAVSWEQATAYDCLRPAIFYDHDETNFLNELSILFPDIALVELGRIFPEFFELDSW